MLVGDSLEAHAVLNISYSDKYFIAANLDPVYGHQDSYAKYGMRLSWGNVDGLWDVALIGENLCDELTSGDSMANCWC